ncbi:Metallo-hydrolase/oxidoreductase [Collybia nuda]|uniref:hydroxyacylglutathione hydrolase n=1 Tax=Collybia nuda TaxID=64659 RepID=A0A9P5XX25_9AGAR|nr:Metallo-hydrolase/oxidoreductase [Collybia nuda]
MKVVPIPVRQDNYAYLLIDDKSNKAAAIDPYDVPKVIAAADSLGVQIVANITTHHHFDHSGGNQSFAEHFPHVPVYGGSDRIPALTQLVKDGEEFTLGTSIIVRCLATQCHTQDSICYYVTDTANKSQPGGVFTGDTLFIAGCGRFFEGTGDEMNRALTYLGTLPNETIVYNGHEYTAGNLAFGKTIDPKNKALERLADIVRQNKITAGLTTIGDEKEWNVFMRLGSDAVRNATSATPSTPDSTVIDSLRDKKNNFRG